MNKKLVSLLSALSLCVTVTACSNNKDNKTTQNNTKNSINIESLESESVSTVDTYINLGTSTTIDGEGAVVENNKITINKAGTYSISGKIDDGQIIVNAGKEDKVYMILNGADITCKDNSPIYVKQAKKAIIALEDSTENNITDGESYVLEDASSDEPNSAIFSKDDLTIIGTGKLTVNANYNHGIVSKDNLKLQSGNIVVNSKNDGIKGKDCINVTDANITINSEGDGMQSNNDTDETKGYVYIEGGDINITSGQDGIQAQTQLLVANGNITIKTGGGSENSTNSNSKTGFNKGERPTIPSGDLQGQQLPQIPEGMQNGERPTMPGGGLQEQQPPQMPEGMEKGERPAMPNGDLQNQKPQEMQNPNEQSLDNTNINTSNEVTSEESISMKALKASTDIIIDGGNFNIDSIEDSIHSNSNITINDGEFKIASGDDGIHSDSQLYINGGNINISKSYEGIESTIININDGNIHIVASDDGINSAGGNDVSSETNMAGNDKFSATSNGELNINGGYLYVDASGDGLDSNGSIKLSGGTVLVDGPTNNGNGSLDYDSTFDITGGILVASGSSGMAQIPSDSSTQNILNINLTQQNANSAINIKSSNGKNILTYLPAKPYSSVIVSTPEIKDNTKYTVSVGGNVIGEAKDGLFYDETYSKGTEVGSETISSTITNITQEGASTNTMGGKEGFGGKRGQNGENMMRDNNKNTNLETVEQ